ncbi:unnamed protein product [Phytophthora fragariaefolia]|uniref:Unnamed protein product n=1 Tax=Phytophthora fragariaefolia TaxID=1490495 RepID=A0A9W6XT46_9STRA|nr:unnamed protein product [Phytophthora fragariaefolia]
MVTPTPKTPRQQLTEAERRLCLEALLSDRHARRIRRAQQKDVGHKKKASRKAPAKRTTPAMEFAQSKGPNPSVDAATRADIAEAKDNHRRRASDAKETADKVTEEGDETGGLAATVPAELEEIVADMVTSVGVAALSTPEHPPASSPTRWPNSVSVLVSQRRRARSDRGNGAEASCKTPAKRRRKRVMMREKLVQCCCLRSHSRVLWTEMRT